MIDPILAAPRRNPSATSTGVAHRLRVGPRLAALLAIGTLFVASAASVRAQDHRLSTVRRTTIATADPEASLRFYRDLLGFTVEYDVVATEPAQLAAFAPGARTGRAIALRNGARLGGSIGLFHTPGMTRSGPCTASAPAGAVAILLLTDDLDSLYRRLKAGGVPFVNEPHEYDAQGGRGPTATFTVFDPNCVRVAFANIRRESLEQSEQR